MSDNERISEIKRELSEAGFELFGPEQPTDPKHGWFAPIIPLNSRGGTAPYGWGESPLQAAEDALQICRDQSGLG